MKPDYRAGPMAAALEEARAAAAAGEVPVGAVLIHAPTGRIVARARNEVEALNDPTAHAEMLVIRQACRALASERLVGADLYVTLEPCPMCAAAISFARIRRLYFGATDEKGGAVISGGRYFRQPTCHHAPDVYPGMGETQSSELLRQFFRQKRQEP